MAVGRVGTLEKALRVLTHISERQPIPVSRLARELGMDKSAVQRIVVTFEDAGWLRKDRGAAWSLGTQALVVGRRFGDGLVERARPHLEALVAETGETVTLWALRGGSFVALDSVDSTHPLRVVIPVGLEAPLTTAPAVAAFLDEGAQAALGPAVPGEAELAAVRARGYYLVEGVLPSAVAVGAPVHRPHTGDVVAILLITAPTPRGSAEALHRHVPALLRTAALLSGAAGGIAAGTGGSPKGGIAAGSGEPAGA